MPDIVEKFKEESRTLHREVRERTAGYVAAALGLVAGLAWNDAIRALIEYFFPVSQNTVWAKLAYAALLSVIAIAATVVILRWIGKKEEL